jgi:DNA-binding MarR family transcriptional regulator
MTPAGLRALELADKARETLEDEILVGLTADERATLRRLVQRVVERLVQPVAETRA